MSSAHLPRERDEEVRDSKSERKAVTVVTTPRRGISLVGARVGDEPDYK